MNSTRGSCESRTGFASGILSAEAVNSTRGSGENRTGLLFYRRSGFCWASGLEVKVSSGSRGEPEAQKNIRSNEGSVKGFVKGFGINSLS